MQLSDTKSRPLYGKLEPVARATRHIVAAEGEGAHAILEAFGGAPDICSRTTVVYCPRGSAPQALDGKLSGLGLDALHVQPTLETALVRLGGLLATATMGTRLYLTGSEEFVGRATAVAISHGMHGQAIQTEHRGSLARRVQCVHCKGFTDNVTASPTTCSHCGITLLVRDHYSRRLGAFMGVVIDAESPGEAPEPVEFD